MDEVLFRSSQAMDNLQITLDLTATKVKCILIEAWNSPAVLIFRQNLREGREIMSLVSEDLKMKTLKFAHLDELYHNILKLMSNKWTKRDMYMIALGFSCGIVVGVVLTVALRKKNPKLRCMQAVQCLQYNGIESVSVMEDAIAPYGCKDCEVLIEVKSVAVHMVDTMICQGYGRVLRRILGSIRTGRPEFPVTLGRACTGIIIDIGKAVESFDVGDEVWCAVPFWHDGTMCQTIKLTRDRIARKPENVSFQAGASVPYAGCLALDALQRAGLTLENTFNKKVLIQGASTPVGCILFQILVNWNANVTGTCYNRARPVIQALGSSDLIVFPDNLLELSGIAQLLTNELRSRPTFDVIINTNECGLNYVDFLQFTPLYISTIPPTLQTDSYSFIGQIFLSLYLRLMSCMGINDVYDEAHICDHYMEKLTVYAKNNHLHTLVDKIYQPHDIEIALNHIKSTESIGSTIITFK